MATIDVRCFAPPPPPTPTVRNTTCGACSLLCARSATLAPGGRCASGDRARAHGVAEAHVVAEAMGSPHFLCCPNPWGPPQLTRAHGVAATHGSSALAACCRFAADHGGARHQCGQLIATVAFAFTSCMSPWRTSSWRSDGSRRFIGFRTWACATAPAGGAATSHVRNDRGCWRTHLPVRGHRIGHRISSKASETSMCVNVFCGRIIQLSYWSQGVRVVMCPPPGT